MCVIRMANGHTHVDDVERFLSAFDNRPWLKSNTNFFCSVQFPPVETDVRSFAKAENNGGDIRHSIRYKTDV